MKYKKVRKPENWIISGIPILFLIGSMMHFIYDFTGKFALIGAFAPVNESIWEHLKMLLIPMICWWCIYYIVNVKKLYINKEKWFYANIISIISSMLVVISFYYTYTGALGIESLAIDIFSLFLGITVGQYLGLHIYKHSNGINYFISIFILILLIATFVLFTFNPPHLPIFRDGASDRYGIY